MTCGASSDKGPLTPGNSSSSTSKEPAGRISHSRRRHRLRPSDQAFWVVGKDLVRVDRRGQKLLNIANFAAWTCVSVARFLALGEAWLGDETPSGCGAEPAFSESARRVRSSRAQRRLESFEVACDPGTGQAWVVDLGKALVRVPRGEQPRDPLPIPALAVAIGSKSGQISIATRDQILRLRYGVAVVKTTLGKPSGQVWLAAF